MYDGLTADNLREMIKGEMEVFNANVEGLYQLIDETEDEISQLEREKQALIEARDGLSTRKTASLFDQSASIAQAYLNKWREATAHNAAIAEAAAANQALVGRDGVPLKPVKTPELKLLHKLTIQLKPAPLATASSSSSPPEVSPTTAAPTEKKSTGFFGVLKAKLNMDSDKPTSPVPVEDQEAQALCRFGLSINHCPGHRFVDVRSTEAVEVASVCFALRVANEGPDALTHKDAGDLAAFINMTIHNALSATANAAHESGLEEELRSSGVVKRHEEIQSAIAAAQERRAAAQRVLDSMIVDVTATPLPAVSGAAQCFNCTVKIKQRPDPEFFATVDKIVASEAYRMHQAKAEKAYAIVETFALHDFSATIDVGVAARPPPVLDEVDRRVLATSRRAVAIHRTRQLWRQHRKLLTDEERVAATVTDTAKEQELELREGGAKARSAVATEKLGQLVDAARPALLALIDGFIHPAVHRTVCPSTANPNPLEQAPVAANLYMAQVFRAPREIVKIAVNEAYDKAAAKAAEDGEASRAAAVRLSAAKAKVSAALGLYDDLYFEVVPFPTKSTNQKKRAAILLKRAETNTAAAVNYLSERGLAALRELMNERQAVIDAEAQEGNARSALRDAASALAAVARAIGKLTDAPEEKSSAYGKTNSRYDVTLCGCEAAAPLVLSIVVKPPPSMFANVEASRVSWVLGLQPAPASATSFTGRQPGRPCRCAVFNSPIQLLLGDIAVKICDLAEEHSPFRETRNEEDDEV